jgi:hypothetical protein
MLLESSAIKVLGNSHSSETGHSMYLYSSEKIRDALKISLEKTKS